MNETASNEHCIVCGEPLKAGAGRCNACKSLQTWTATCASCGARVPEDARKCHACGAYPHAGEHPRAGKPCVACGELLPPEAELCTRCDSLQALGTRFKVGHTTLALIVSLISVLGIVIPAIGQLWRLNSSHTTVHFLDFGDPSSDRFNSVYLQASNTGKRTSTVTAARLSLATHLPDTQRIPPMSKDLQIGFVSEETRDREVRDVLFVEPGATRIVELIHPGFSANALRVDMASDQFRTYLRSAVLEVGIAEFAEQTRHRSIRVPRHDLEVFLKRTTAK